MASDPYPIRCDGCGTRHGALRMFAGFGVRCWQCCAGSALISWRHGVNARVEVRDVRTEETPDACPTCGGSGRVPKPEWSCGCGPMVSHVADCGRRAPTVPCPECRTEENPDGK